MTQPTFIARVPMCMAIALFVFAFGVTSVAAQSAGSSVQGAGCFLGICDPGVWLQDTVNRITSNFLGGLIEGVGGAITAFPDDTNFILHTPAALSYRNDQVQQFQSGARLVANALLVVVTLVGGFNVTARPYLGSTYHAAMALIPQLLLGAILINGA